MTWVTANSVSENIKARQIESGLLLRNYHKDSNTFLDRIYILLPTLLYPEGKHQLNIKIVIPLDGKKRSSNKNNIKRMVIFPIDGNIW